MPLSFVQEFTFETRHLGELEKALNFLCPILSYWIEDGIIIDKEESLFKQDNYPSYAASYFLSGKTPEAVPKLHKFICGIEQKRTNAESENCFYSLEETVKTGLDLAKNADQEKFIEETGNGAFEGCEGSVRVGYRIHWRNRGLIISLCHIYYSKWLLHASLETSFRRRKISATKVRG